MNADTIKPSLKVRHNNEMHKAVCVATVVHMYADVHS